jgi:hypothetical protein
MTEILIRLTLAWAALRHGKPADDLAIFRALIASPRSALVQRAVRKMAENPNGHLKSTAKRDKALDLATTYEYGARRRCEWEHAFLLEYHVGKEKGRL